MAESQLVTSTGNTPPVGVVVTDSGARSPLVGACSEKVAVSGLLRSIPKVRMPTQAVSMWGSLAFPLLSVGNPPTLIVPGAAVATFGTRPLNTTVDVAATKALRRI